MLTLKLNSIASTSSLVFFGGYCLSLGYLIVRSNFLPRVLGLLMMVAGLGWTTFLSPPFAMNLSPFLQVVGVVAEASLMLWLLVAGVNVECWKEQAGAAESG